MREVVCKCCDSSVERDCSFICSDCGGSICLKCYVVDSKCWMCISHQLAKQERVLDIVKTLVGMVEADDPETAEICVRKIKSVLDV